MNTKQAKELSLPDFLAQLGHAPVRTRGSDIWYTSPFRPDEHTPSFKIDHQKNVWFDFGMGKGGTIIDFVQHLYNTTDVARALSLIVDVNGGTATPAVTRHAPEMDAPRSRPVVQSVGAVTDRALEAYVLDRAIPLDLARLYLQEIRYQVEGRDYKALAFANDSGGFEVRNPGFKGSIGTKDITYLAIPERIDAAVFEGVFDLLSALTYYGMDRPASNVLVLNSVGMLDRGVERLDGAGIRRLQTYLDHDPAGDNTWQQLRQRGTWDMRDASSFYLGYKDANEFLKERAGRNRGDDRNR